MLANGPEPSRQPVCKINLDEWWYGNFPNGFPTYCRANRVRRPECAGRERVALYRLVVGEGLQNPWRLWASRLSSLTRTVLAIVAGFITEWHFGWRIGCNQRAKNGSHFFASDTTSWELACLFYCRSVCEEASIRAADRAAVTTSRIALVTTSGWSR